MTRHRRFRRNSSHHHRYFARFGGNSATGPSLPNAPVTCAEQHSPCEVTKLYLASYTAGDYPTMFQYISDASKTRFSDPAIRGTIYANAHDYVVNRTTSLLRQAEVYGISATQGSVRSVSPTAATVPVHVMRNRTR